MDPARAHAVSAVTPVFSDGLGDRVLTFDKTSGDALESLNLRAELTAVPSFEFALRERVGRLANFRHGYYARVRRVDRTPEPDGLAIVSDHTPGARLSEILAATEREGLTLDINAALCLVRQLVPAVAMLHQNAREVAHGALGPERIVVTPHARLVIAEYVLGSALEQLRYSHERLWKDFRIAMPASAGLPRFDHRADVTQVGMTALALIVGRPLRDDEYPKRISDVLAAATETSALGGREPLGAPLRAWLARALQLDYRSSFHSALEAQQALDDLLSDDSGYIAAPIALETFLAQYHDRAAAPSKPAPGPSGGRAAEPEPPRPVVVRQKSDAPKVEQPPAAPAFDPLGVLEPLASPSATPAHKSDRRRAAEPHVPPMPAGSTLEAAEPSRAQVLAREIGPEPAEAPHAARGKRRWARYVAAVLGVAVLVQGAYIGWRLRSGPGVSTEGTLSIESRPSGAAVVVDGKERGVTPLKVMLPAGPHVLEIKSAGEPRVIPLTVQAGVVVSQYIELPEAPAIAGQLQVRSEPAGAKVSIDGQMRGVAPMLVPDLAPGEHDVLLTSDVGEVKQKVTIEAGVTASLVVPLTSAPGAPVSGWVSVNAPVEVQVFEGGRLLGTSETDRIMVAAGRHEFEIVNETLSYRVTRIVQIPPGRVAGIRVELPRGTLSVNAVPWAEVWIDGQKAGETPIGNLSLPIGPHEVVFRHPQLGEQRHAATVTLAGPTRLSVDLRK
jgi:PEGA domain-containing protein